MCTLVLGEIQHSWHTVSSKGCSFSFFFLVRFDRHYSHRRLFGADGARGKGFAGNSNAGLAKMYFCQPPQLRASTAPSILASASPPHPPLVCDKKVAGCVPHSSALLRATLGLTPPNTFLNTALQCGVSLLVLAYDF
jgi:hypothetical protein